MNIRNTTGGYGALARAVHWASALAVVIALILCVRAVWRRNP